MAVTEIREVQEQSWVQRLGGSFKGVLVGLALFAAGFPVLFLNEGRAVATSKRLEEGARTVVPVAADKIDGANEGKLVHVSGKAETKDVLTDPDTGLQMKGIALKRKVEFYQWVQIEDKVREKQGDKTIEKTTYSYRRDWCPESVDSSKFKEAGHENPPVASFLRDKTIYAQNVTLGAFRLNEQQIKKTGKAEIVTLPEEFKPAGHLEGARKWQTHLFLPYVQAPLNTSEMTAAQTAVEAATNAVRNALVLKERKVEMNPVIGDVRITYSLALPGEVSIVAKQTGGSFAPWRASDGKSFDLHKNGIFDAAQMFDDAQSSNTNLTWIIRGVGFLLMFVGLKLFFGPVAVLVDVIPVLNGIVAAGVSLIAFLVSAACSILTIGIAWVAYRPVLGCLLIAGAVAIVVFAALKKKNAAAASAASAS